MKSAAAGAAGLALSPAVTSAWLKAGASSLLCCNIPEEYGGMGGDRLYSTVLMEEQSYAGITGPGFAVHSDIVANYILNFGTEAQKQAWLPKMASGDAVGAIIPDAGAQFETSNFDFRIALDLRPLARIPVVGTVTTRNLLQDRYTNAVGSLGPIRHIEAGVEARF